MRDLDRLARSWIFAQKLGVDRPGYDKHIWAVDEMIDLAIDSPDELWLAILRILEIDSTEEVVKAVGAGPLEDLMVQHGEQFINEVEKYAAKSAALKNAIKNVWLDEKDTPIWERFFNILENEKKPAENGPGDLTR